MAPLPRLGGGLRAWHTRFVALFSDSAFVSDVIAPLPQNFKSVVTLTKQKNRRVAETPRIDTSATPVASYPNTPHSAVPELCFGANQFSAGRVVISKGYYATWNIDIPTVLELWLHRTVGDPTRVAQLSADCEVEFDVRGPTIRHSGGVYYVMPGVTVVEGPSKYYFLSRAPF